MIARYRVQLINCEWSEWRDINTPIKEEYILSIQVNEHVTPAQYEEFKKQVKVI